MKKTRTPGLREIQRLMATAIMSPLTADYKMRSLDARGRSMRKLASTIVAPGKSLSSFERLQIYNQQYWYRLLDCMYEDFPGLLSVLGERKFRQLIEAYLVKHPPDSFALSHVGKYLPEFVSQACSLCAGAHKLAQQMAAFELAQIEAFDAADKPAVTTEDVNSTPPQKLRLAVQPHVHLLQLDYALDEFDIALKKTMRSVSEGGLVPGARGKKKKAKPERQRLYLAVHRYDNDIYYKRLEPVAFVVLQALKDGMSLYDAIRTGRNAFPRASLNQLNDALQLWFAEFSRLGWLCKR